MAKKLCENKAIEYQYKHLDVDYSHEDLLQLTEGKARTYPQIFDGERLVGGFTEFQKEVMSKKT